MRIARRNPLLALTWALALVSACGGGSGQQAGPDGGAGAYGLGVVGSPTLQAHPQDVRTVQVVLAQAEVGPVGNAKVHFSSADGDLAGAQFDHADTTTGPDGVATLKLTLGQSPTAFKVVASAPDFQGVGAVAVAVNVVPVRKVLQIEGAPQIKVSTDGQSAAVDLFISSSLGLKVRVIDASSGQPVAGDTLTFSIGKAAGGGTPKSAFGGGAGTSATAKTGTSGEAQAFLVSSNVTETFLVTASDAGVGQVSFSVTIDATAPTGCTSSQQCPAGEICVQGNCTTSNGGGGQCGAGTDTPCPFGYTCDPKTNTCQPPANPSCDPNNPKCPSTQSCQCTGAPGAQSCQCEDICPTCQTGSHCQVTGNTGTCVPDGANVPDLTGVWYTKHTYSLQQALPNFLVQINKVIRIIDQLIHGDFFSGALSFLNGIIKGIIDQYVPAWVKTIFAVLDDIGTIFSNLRSVGSMRIVPGADKTHVKGSEVWTSLVFYWLPLCNGNIGGDPAIPPDCARFDVATTDSDNPGDPLMCKGQSVPAISVKVSGFTGSIAGSGPNHDQAPWTFNVDQRQVQLKMGKVVLIAINLLLSQLTEYQCIEDALDCTPDRQCLIDCASLGQTLSDAVGGFISPQVLTDVCYPAVTAAGTAITNVLETLSFDTDALDFHGHASIGLIGDPSIDPSVCTSQTLCAGKLGQDNFDYVLQKTPASRDGNWEGSFFYKLLNNMPGAWTATRTPANP